MKFVITGLNEDDKFKDNIDENGNVIGALGGTEMIRENLLKRIDPNILKHFNIIHSRVRNISEEKKNILVLHDTWNDPEVQHLREEEKRKRFSKLVFVSNYQFQTYHLAHSIPYKESMVLHNAIDPIEDHEKNREGPLRLIYHTTPHRGLELLVPAFEALYEKHKDKIHLDVYSSFKIYGWPHRDEPYEKVFDRCNDHPGITYHGVVSNDKIREALKNAHIFAYPNIWPETSCISMMEAMSAKCCVICPNHAALAETCANFAVMYQFHEDVNIHANLFARILDVVINNYWEDNHMSKLKFQKIYSDNFYSWDSRIPEWEVFLKTLISNDHK